MADPLASLSIAAGPTGSDHILQCREPPAGQLATSIETDRIRKSQYLNNRTEQDHRRIKRRVRPMLGFKSFATAIVTLAGIGMVHMMRKRQGRLTFNSAPFLKEQFEAIAA